MIRTWCHKWKIDLSICDIPLSLKEIRPIASTMCNSRREVLGQNNIEIELSQREK